ncbi:MAG: tetratricopeptide repeat protein [Anaerolineae bacterium]|nr:tetratricopeptide repeat protein [Anaerolineae bacterium]
MAVVPLTDTESCNSYWKSCIQNNLIYWHTFLPDHSADISALDQEHETIVKAILYGLKLEPAWADAYGLIVTMADFMERRGYWDMWHMVLHQAQTAASQNHDEVGRVMLSALSARLNHRQGNFSEMVRDYRRTIRLARRSNDVFNEARACTNLGYFYVEQGHWYRAEVLCCHALHLFEQLDSDHGKAHTENHLGMLRVRQNRLAQGQVHLTRAYEIWQKMGDDYGMMLACINLSALFNEQERPGEALPWLEEAVRRAKAIGEEAWLGTILMNMSNSFRLAGNFSEAESHLWQASVIFHRHSDKLGQAMTLDNLGLLAYAQGNSVEGSQYLTRAIEAWQALNHGYNEIRAMSYLVEGKLAEKNDEEADFWLTQAEHRLDQLNGPTTQDHKPLHSKLAELRRSLNTRPRK